MAIFNDVEPEARASINNALTDDTSDDFSIGVRYINDVSAYHPSDRYFELLLDIIAATNDPKVVVEVVHGAWERYDDSKYLYCSNCGEPAATSEDVSWHGYCPICGAIMDGKCEAE